MADNNTESILTDLPLERKGYSDRTAALLARLSKCAYIRFEETETTYVEKILRELNGVLTPDQHSGEPSEAIRRRAKLIVTEAVKPENLAPYRANLNKLELELDALGMDLVAIINEPVTDSQAYVAKVRADKVNHPLGPKTAVIVFRGSEREIKDWATNFSIGDVRMKCGTHSFQIHYGFLRAYKGMQRTLEATLMPLVAEGYLFYITGHSLGGALAMIATHQLGRVLIDYEPDHDFDEKCQYPNASRLEGERIAACYTFGSPRVAGNGFDQSIKSPLYRIVHADDPVPGVPPVYLPTLLLLIQKPVSRIPWVRTVLPVVFFMTGHIARVFRFGIMKKCGAKIAMTGDVLKVASQFVHHGDMRYIARRISGKPLMVLSNPDLLVRATAFLLHITRHARTLVADHNMDKYVELTDLYARQRQEDAMAEIPRPFESPWNDSIALPQNPLRELSGELPARQQ